MLKDENTKKEGDVCDLFSQTAPTAAQAAAVDASCCGAQRDTRLREVLQTCLLLKPHNSITKTERRNTMKKAGRGASGRVWAAGGIGRDLVKAKKERSDHTARHLTR